MEALIAIHGQTNSLSVMARDRVRPNLLHYPLLWHGPIICAAMIVSAYSTSIYRLLVHLFIDRLNRL